MATWQDFYVAPTATQGLAQGLGTLGKAYFQKQAQQEQEKKIFDQRMGFMNAMKGAFAIQDPQERETALMDIQLQYPEQLTQFYQATQEQQKARTTGMEKQPEKKMGTGEMSGYVFDPATGEYSISPEVKEALAQKAQWKAEEGGKLSAKDIQGINKDVTSLIGDTVDINRAANDLAKLKSTSSPTDQLAAIFKFMKALDPTSVVREGEQQMAKTTGGPADFLVAYVNQIKGEGELPPKAFANMVNTAKNLSDSAVNASSTEINSYLDVYGDTLPDTLKSRIKSRIPKMFTQDQVSTVLVMTHPQYGEITEADIEQTMRANNLTREQVLQRLGGK